MKPGEKELEKLAEIIVAKIKEEFAIKKLSGNLVKTIKVENMGDEIKIHIPAQTYNMLKFQNEGVIVHTSHGSYASKLDEVGSEFYIYHKPARKGSFKVKPHNHIGYIDRVIQGAILEWRGLINGKVEKVEG